MTRPRSEDFEISIAPDAGAPAEVCAIVRRVLAAAAAECEKLPRLSIRILGDREMAELHKRFLGARGPTDVLAFPLGAERPDEFDGEIVVCAPEAARRAADFDNSVAAELGLYVVHGLLHLLGYDDRDEESARDMRAVERRVLERCALTVRGRFERDARR